MATRLRTLPIFDACIRPPLDTRAQVYSVLSQLARKCVLLHRVSSLRRRGNLNMRAATTLGHGGRAS